MTQELDQSCGLKVGAIVRTSAFTMLCTHDGAYHEFPPGSIMTFAGVVTFPTQPFTLHADIDDDEWCLAFIIDGLFMRIIMSPVDRSWFNRVFVPV